MKDRKIWHLISNRWNSAITEYALSAAKALELMGYNNTVTAIAYSPADRRAKEYGLATAPIKNFSIRRLAELRALSESIKAEKVLLYGGPETFLSRFLGKNSFYRFFGQELNGRLARSKAIFSLSYSHVEKFIVPNQILKLQISPLVPEKEVRRILIGMDIKVPSIQSGSEKKELLVLGRLDPVKGHARILKIFGQMLKHWPPSEFKPALHIVGQDANLSAEDIKTLIANEGLHLGEEVILTNTRVEKITELLENSCVGLIPSIGSEHICRVAEEFLLVGTPIFVSGAGATEETLFPNAGETYKGLNDRDASELLMKFVLKSRKDSGVERQMRSENAKEFFSLKTMGESLESVLFS